MPAVWGAAAVVVGSRIGDILNFVNSLVLGRWLSLAEFGQASAILSAIGIPAAALGFLICRETVWLSETQERRRLLRYVWRWTFRILAVGAVAAVGMVVFQSYIKEIFRFERNSVIYVFAALIIVTLIKPLWASVIQGQRRFVILGTIPAIEAVTRLLATMGLIYAGFRLTGALAGTLTAGLLTIGWVVFWSNRPFARKEEIRGPADVSVRERPPQLDALLGNMVTVTRRALLLASDIIVVNYLFSGTSGGFAAVATVGKIALFLPQSIAIIIFPLVVRNEVYGKDNSMYLLVSVGLALCVSVAVVAIFYFWHEPIMSLYRREFADYAYLLTRYAIAMGFFSVVRLCAIYAMAREIRTLGWYILFLAVLQILGFYLFRQSMWRIVNVVLVFSIVGAVGSFLLARPFGRRGSSVSTVAR